MKKDEDRMSGQRWKMKMKDEDGSEREKMEDKEWIKICLNLVAGCNFIPFSGITL